MSDTSFAKKGNLPAIAAGELKLQFDDAPEGEILGVDVEMTFDGISSGSGFNISNPTGDSKPAKGGDDLDKVLDFLIAAAGVQLTVDGKHYNIRGMDASLVRSELEDANREDFRVGGAMVDGTAIAATGGSTKSLSFRAFFPFDLSKMPGLPDGDQYRQGSDRVKEGWLSLTFAAIAGNVATVNSGIDKLVISNLAWGNVQYRYRKNGFRTYVGPDWKINNAENLNATNPKLEAGIRVRMKSYDTADEGSTLTWSMPAQGNPRALNRCGYQALIDDFNREFRSGGEDWNPCARAIPLLWPAKNTPLDRLDVSPYAPQLTNEKGTAQKLVHFFIQPAPATALRAAMDFPGGKATEIRFPVASTNGRRVPAERLGLRGVAFVPGHQDGAKYGLEVVHHG